MLTQNVPASQGILVLKCFDPQVSLDLEKLAIIHKDSIHTSLITSLNEACVSKMAHFILFGDQLITRETGIFLPCH